MKAAMIRRFQAIHEHMVAQGRETSAAAIKEILDNVQAQRLEPKDFGMGLLFNAVNQAVIVVNAATECIVLWNEQATKIFGYTETEALGMELHALVVPELVERHRQGLRRFQETGKGEFIEASTPLALQALTKDGERIDISLVLAGLPDPYGGDERHVLGLVLETITAAVVAEN